MLKEIVLPPIDMKNFSSQPIDTNLIIMSHDFNVNELVIPFYETNVFDTYEAFYSFQGNTSIIIQEVFNQHNEIRIPIVNEVRRHKGIFTIELNASSNSTQATLLKLNVMVKRSNIDSNSEFLFNHYYKLFEDYKKEIAELNNATQSTIKTQLKQAQDNLQKVSQTLIAINDKVMVVNDTTDGFMVDVATKQADVTSKYNAFDTDITEANQTIDELLALQPQFQAVLDETTGKDVISAPEIILARGGEADLKTRLDKEKQEVTAQLAQKVTGTFLDSVPEDLSIYQQNSVLFFDNDTLDDHFSWSDDFEGGAINADLWTYEQTLQGLVSQKDEKVVFDTRDNKTERAFIRTNKGINRKLNGKLVVRMKAAKTLGGNPVVFEMTNVKKRNLGHDITPRLVCTLTQRRTTADTVDKYGVELSIYKYDDVGLGWNPDKFKWQQGIHLINDFFKSEDTLRLETSLNSGRIAFKLINEDTGREVETQPYPISDLRGHGNSAFGYFYPQLENRDITVPYYIEWLNVSYRVMSNG